MVLSIIFLTGCTQLVTPPGSSFVDRTMTDYSFTDVTNSCNITHNVDINNYTSPCTGGQEKFTMFYTEQNNWSVMCCDYNNKCSAGQDAVVDNMCVDNNDKYTGYLFNDQGFWMAQCCDSSGGNCYVDLQVDVNDETTICDETYKQNIYAPNFNGTTWNSMCCVGGLQE